ncbi:Ribosomal RNA processing protein 1 B, variant 2 [Balamuthia mandrillaris]
MERKHEDPKIRNRGVRVVKRWLAKQDNISELDCKKLWRGLFFCMWHSDKPKIQQEVAETLASFVHIIPPNKALLYVKVFFWTMQREWHSIDRLRLDKFYSLVRKVVFHAFKWLQAREWAESLVREFAAIASQLALCPLNIGKVEDVPVNAGITLHVTEVYLPELRKLLKECPPEQRHLPQRVFTLLLTPFINIVTLARDKPILSRTKEHVFDVIKSEVSKAVENDGKGDEEEAEEEKEPVDDIFLDLDFNGLAQILFQLASSRDTPDSNRNHLYRLKNVFLELDKQTKSLRPSVAANGQKEEDENENEDEDENENEDEVEEEMENGDEEEEENEEEEQEGVSSSDKIIEGVVGTIVGEILKMAAGMSKDKDPKANIGVNEIKAAMKELYEASQALEEKDDDDDDDDDAEEQREEENEDEEQDDANEKQMEEDDGSEEDDDDDDDDDELDMFDEYVEEELGKDGRWKKGGRIEERVEEVLQAIVGEILGMAGEIAHLKDPSKSNTIAEDDIREAMAGIYEASQEIEELSEEDEDANEHEHEEDEEEAEHEEDEEEEEEEEIERQKPEKKNNKGKKRRRSLMEALEEEEENGKQEGEEGNSLAFNFHKKSDSANATKTATLTSTATTTNNGMEDASQSNKKKRRRKKKNQTANNPTTTATLPLPALPQPRTEGMASASSPEKSNEANGNHAATRPPTPFPQLTKAQQKRSVRFALKANMRQEFRKTDIIGCSPVPSPDKRPLFGILKSSGEALSATASSPLSRQTTQNTKNKNKKQQTRNSLPSSSLPVLNGSGGGKKGQKGKKRKGASASSSPSSRPSASDFF